MWPILSASGTLACQLKGILEWLCSKFSISNRIYHVVLPHECFMFGTLQTFHFINVARATASNYNYHISHYFPLYKRKFHISDYGKYVQFLNFTVFLPFFVLPSFLMSFLLYFFFPCFLQPSYQSLASSLFFYLSCLSSFLLFLYFLIFISRVFSYILPAENFSLFSSNCVSLKQCVRVTASVLISLNVVKPSSWNPILFQRCRSLSTVIIISLSVCISRMLTRI
jgi:hypothetical protein